jgi:hypothetical protein
MAAGAEAAYDSREEARSGMPPACLLVIFGASGDLTRRLLIPDLFGLHREGGSAAGWLRGARGFANRLHGRCVQDLGEGFSA